MKRRKYNGSTFADREEAPFRVLEDGTVLLSGGTFNTYKKRLRADGDNLVLECFVSNAWRSVFKINLAENGVGTVAPHIELNHFGSNGTKYQNLVLGESGLGGKVNKIKGTDSYGNYGIVYFEEGLKLLTSNGQDIVIAPGGTGEIDMNANTAIFATIRFFNDKLVFNDKDGNVILEYSATKIKAYKPVELPVFAGTLPANPTEGMTVIQNYNGTRITSYLNGGWRSATLS